MRPIKVVNLRALYKEEKIHVFIRSPKVIPNKHDLL